MKILKMYIESKNTRYDYSKEEPKPYTEYIFIAKIKIGMKIKYYRFVTMSKKYVCAFLDDEHMDEMPKNDKLRKEILIKVYGKLMQILAEWEMEETLIKIDKEIEEEKRKKEQEEKAKRIALGEQVTIEKYLKNL